MCPLDAAEMKLSLLLFLTHSVGQNLQPHHPLVTVQLQAVDAVEAVIFDQVEGGVNRDLVQDRPLPLGRLT